MKKIDKSMSNKNSTQIWTNNECYIKNASNVKENRIYK
jgi:hypothetical protein